MEAKAIARYVRMTPRKAGQVARLIRGKSVTDALHLLKWVRKASAPIVEKAVRSAFANLQKKQASSKPESTLVREITVNGGPIMKYALRYIPRAMGRASKIHKRTCHITVVVDERTVPALKPVKEAK